MPILASEVSREELEGAVLTSAPILNRAYCQVHSYYCPFSIIYTYLFLFEVFGSFNFATKWLLTLKLIPLLVRTIL
jgi:hypothetical protein